MGQPWEENPRDRGDRGLRTAGGAVALCLGLFLFFPAVYLLVVAPFGDFDHEVCGRRCGPAGPLSAIAAGATLLAIAIGLGLLAARGLGSVPLPARLACLLIAGLTLLGLGLPARYAVIGAAPLALLLASKRSWWESIPVLDHPWWLVLLGLPTFMVTGFWFFTCSSCFN